jgi:hypothetical protein
MLSFARFYLFSAFILAQQVFSMLRQETLHAATLLPLTCAPRGLLFSSAGTQFTCFTSTKAQIRARRAASSSAAQVLSLLALLVQKHKYVRAARLRPGA